MEFNIMFAINCPHVKKPAPLIVIVHVIDILRNATPYQIIKLLKNCTKSSKIWQRISRNESENTVFAWACFYADA